MKKQLKKLVIPALILAFLVLFVPKGELSADEAVSISGTIDQSLTIGVSSSSTDFGTLSPASINNSPDITLTISTNAANGFSITVRDAGEGVNPGLYKSIAPTSLIASSTTTLSTGTEGYGIQAATTAAGSGATVTIVATYLKTVNDVGGLSTTDTSLASVTGPADGREVAVAHKTAISSMTPPGSYTDTLTYVCTGNF